MQDAKTGSIPRAQSEQVITEVKHGSAYMQLAKAIDISKPETAFTHMSGVGAYWVDEAQRIETSKPKWLKVVMRTKKMGVIIPTSKENLRYSVTDFFELMRPEITEAFAKKLDSAAIADIDNPFTWSILGSATTTGQLVAETANKYDDINAAMGYVEEADKDPNAVASLRKQKRLYRGTKDDNGHPIFNPATAGEPDSVLGLPIAYMHNMAFGTSDIAEIVGDWNNAYYGILQNIEYEILTEATLTTIEADDAPGKPVSLAERDMVAIKATMEVGIMIVKDTAFAVVKKASGGISGASVESLSDMTIPELRIYAEDREIDLSGLTLKGDIVAAIDQAQREQSDA